MISQSEGLLLLIPLNFPCISILSFLLREIRQHTFDGEKIMEPIACLQPFNAMSN